MVCAVCLSIFLSFELPNNSTCLAPRDETCCDLKKNTNPFYICISSWISQMCPKRATWKFSFEMESGKSSVSPVDASLFIICVAWSLLPISSSILSLGENPSTTCSTLFSPVSSLPLPLSLSSIYRQSPGKRYWSFTQFQTCKSKCDKLW